jgi:hypothetical protein
MNSLLRNISQGLVADNVFVKIALPDIARIQFTPGAAGKSRFERGNNCAYRT